MNIARVAIVLAFVCVVPALSGCSTTLPAQTKPDLTLAGLPPMGVNVGMVEVINRYNPAADPQDVSSSFPTPPTSRCAGMARRG